MPVLRDIVVGAAAALALAPALARAGNGDLPRTPVVHRGEACMTLVDRSVDPVVHLEYTVPSNDLCLTADELPGSRTHQLVAFCRNEPPARVVPHWLSWSEVEASEAAGLLATGPVPASDVLEGHPDYADCWRRIVPDDARREISCAAARPGVDWDTSDLPPGAHVVAGYTYAPPLNMWSPRRGVFKVHDGDPDAAPPAVAVMTRPAFLWKHQPLQVSLCVDATDGARLHAAYAVSTPEPQWVTFLADEPIEPGALELEFLPPPEHAGDRLALRVEVEDPLGRRALAYLPGDITVLTTEDPSCATEGECEAGDGGDSSSGGGFDFCRDSPQADAPPPCPELGSSSETGASGSGEDPGEDGGQGCACASGQDTSGQVRSASLALLAALALRRRRRVRGAR